MECSSKGPEKQKNKNCPLGKCHIGQEKEKCLRCIHAIYSINKTYKIKEYDKV